MKCIYHNDRDAEFICSSCGQPVCRDCLTIVNGRNVCKSCANRSQNTNPNGDPNSRGNNYKQSDGYSGFLFFIFMAVPGLRHMYLGLMKRGLQFLATFFILVAFASTINILSPLFVPLACIVWFYSAFDSYHCRKMLARGEAIPDNPIFEDYGYNDIKVYLSERKSAVGTIIILLGVYMLFKEVSHYAYNEGMFRIISIASNMFIPVLLIIGGIYMLSKAKKDK
jgi:hypothetical protein